jgi:hypothetical protein
MRRTRAHCWSSCASRWCAKALFCTRQFRVWKTAICQDRLRTKKSQHGYCPQGSEEAAAEAGSSPDTIQQQQEEEQQQEEGPAAADEEEEEKSGDNQPPGSELGACATGTAKLRSWILIYDLPPTWHAETAVDALEELLLLHTPDNSRYVSMHALESERLLIKTEKFARFCARHSGLSRQAQGSSRKR